jgi:hypothetical protein
MCGICISQYLFVTSVVTLAGENNFLLLAVVVDGRVERKLYRVAQSAVKRPQEPKWLVTALSEKCSGEVIRLNHLSDIPTIRPQPTPHHDFIVFAGSVGNSSLTTSLERVAEAQ